ncbi:hypothetical protein SAMN04487761_10361 [Lachnospiraceae bacterium C7]|nr:hypothetical protein SAMN04487761_10361 [Lachnospiraceae bacterium C7]
MDTIFNQFGDWLKSQIIPVLMAQLRAMYDGVNAQVDSVSSQAGMTPARFSPQVFNMIKSVSENAIMPIAGIILTFVACYELIQLIMSYNNLANFETWFIFKWVIKTFVAVELITHTFDFTMAVFDVTQTVITRAGGIINGSTAIDASALSTMQSTIERMSIWGVLFLFLQIWIIGLATNILSKVIFVIIYARMIEIYLMVSLAPIPFATLGNKEQGVMGQNYIRSLFALGFQGFLILICVGIYAVLIRTVAFSSDIIGSLWGVLGYTILLAFTLFKTGSIAKSVLNAH